MIRCEAKLPSFRSGVTCCYHRFDALIQIWREGAWAWVQTGAFLRHCGAATWVRNGCNAGDAFIVLAEQSCIRRSAALMMPSRIVALH
jgi:hypothetical protein